MPIKSTVTDSGTPIKIIPFSPETFLNLCKEDSFQDVLSARMITHHASYEYVTLQEKLKSLLKEIKEKAPELGSMVLEIDDKVVEKEVQCFDAGYKAGMIDLMTTLTFNDLNITQTQTIDFKAIDKSRREKGLQVLTGDDIQTA